MPGVHVRRAWVTDSGAQPPLCSAVIKSRGAMLRGDGNALGANCEVGDRGELAMS